MAVERRKFREIFQENPDGSLRLLIKLKVNGNEFPIGTEFTATTKLGGVDFHRFRYFDVAIEGEGDAFVISGFYTQVN